MSRMLANRLDSASRRPLKTATLVTSALVLLSLFAFLPGANARQPEPKEYDRLDGHGLSKNRVDVIEWENNLEIHVYPKGRLKSLGMVMDRKNKDNPVMVIEYAFQNIPYTMIRRAKITIPMKDGFKAFVEPSADGYDKVIISNNTLSEGVKPYALAPAPKQLYPDHYGEPEKPESKLADQGSPELGAPAAVEEPAKTYSGGARRTPSESPRIRFGTADEVEQNGSGTTRRRLNPAPEDAGNGEGGIKNFAF